MHALIALFMVGGLAAIWVGSGLGWEWVHHRLFRLAHLFTIGLVSSLSLLGRPPALLRYAGLGVHALIRGVRSGGAADLARGPAPTTHVTQRRLPYDLRRVRCVEKPGCFTPGLFGLTRSLSLAVERTQVAECPRLSLWLSSKLLK